MIELVSADEMRKIEQHMIDDVGIPSIVLMERAALFTAEKMQAICGGQSGKRVLVACGMGNNGADGLALARILAERNYYVTIVTVGKKEKRSQLNALQYQIYRSICVKDQITEITLDELVTRTETKDIAYDVIVDAILGIGVSRKPEGEFARIVDCINRLPGCKIAMDIPTGIHTDTGISLGTYVRADATMTFGRVKTGLLLQDGKLAAGEILVDSCGMYDPNQHGISRNENGCDDRTNAMPDIEQRTFAFTEEDLRGVLQRNPNGNKGSFGKIAMIVGSKMVPGAAMLSVGGAFRSGAGYLQVCTHEANRSLIMEQNPETVLKMYTDEKQICAHLDAMLTFAEVVAIGCGLGVEMAKFVLETLVTDYMKQLKSVKAVILDADALTAIANSDVLKQKIKALPCEVVLTPHVKEFERISGIQIAEVKENRIENARNFAKEWNVTLVLKDAQTIVAAPDGKVMINTFGNDGMAVAGSGDVLCGVIAAMAGQIDNLFMAVNTGVVLHAVAGDRAALALGRHSMLPQDIIRMLPRVIGEITGRMCDVTTDTD